MAEEMNNSQGAPDSGPVPGSDEYNQAMRAKFQDAQAGQDKSQTNEFEVPGGTANDKDTLSSEEIPGMPENGFEKFYNKETGAYDWENHAKDAEYRLSKANEKSASDDDGEGEAEEAEGDATMDDVFTRAGLKQDDLVTSIKETGKIPDEAREALVKQGIPEGIIDDYLGMYHSHIESALKTSYSYIGAGDPEAGKKQWEEISAFAKDLPQEERDAYNTMLQGPQWKVAVDVLRQHMNAGKPGAGEGALVIGDETSVSSPSGFASREEMQRAISDPRYRDDAAYRAAVYKKIQAGMKPRA